jgi:hypothetical protein
LTCHPLPVTRRQEPLPAFSTSGGSTASHSPHCSTGKIPPTSANSQAPDEEADIKTNVSHVQANPAAGVIETAHHHSYESNGRNPHHYTTQYRAAFDYDWNVVSYRVGLDRGPGPVGAHNASPVHNDAGAVSNRFDSGSISHRLKSGAGAIGAHNARPHHNDTGAVRNQFDFGSIGVRLDCSTFAIGSHNPRPNPSNFGYIDALDNQHNGFTIRIEFNNDTKRLKHRPNTGSVGNSSSVFGRYHCFAGRWYKRSNVL